MTIRTPWVFGQRDKTRYVLEVFSLTRINHACTVPRFTRVDGIDPKENLPKKDFLLTGIRFSDKNNSHIGDDDLQRLLPLDFLTELILPKVGITNGGLRHLAKLL